MTILCKNNKNSLQPEIYIADLAAYNNGHLHGEWVDATLEVEEIEEKIKVLLSNSPVGEEAEEWALHDYSDFCEAELGEYPDLNEVVEVAHFLKENGLLGSKLIGYYGDLESAKEAMENNYCGEYESVSDFAQELTEDTVSGIPENLKYYIDYDSMGRDLELGGDIITIELCFDEVHIFWSR